jgi:hypothetical protein
MAARLLEMAHGTMGATLLLDHQGVVMAKAPAFQFYVKDWLSDPQLKMASFSTKGIWIDMICYMWSAPEPGKVTGTEAELSKLLGATKDEIRDFLDDAEKLGFCDVTRLSRDSHANVTVINRRMNRDWKDKESARLRQQRSRGFDDPSRDCHINVQETTPIRGVVVVGDISLSKEKTKYLECVFLTAEEYQKLVSKNGQSVTESSISILNNYLMGKGKDPYRSHYHTLLGWPLDRAREKTGGQQYDRAGDPRRERTPYAAKGRGADIEPGGVGVPLEYNPEPIPDISDEERQRNLKNIRELISGEKAGDVFAGNGGGNDP